MITDNLKLISKTILIKGVQSLTLAAGATAITVFSKAGASAGLKAIGELTLKDLIK